jgi:hypothetical protein
MKNAKLLLAAIFAALCLVSPTACNAGQVAAITGQRLVIVVATCQGTNTAQYPFSYQWYHNGTAIPGATGVALPTGSTGLANSAYIVQSLSTGDAGSYHVVVTNVAGSFTTADDTLTYVVAPTGGTIQWYLNGIAVTPTP